MRTNICIQVNFSLLLFSHWVVSDSLQLHELKRTSLHCPSLSPVLCSNSCPFHQWVHPTSVVPFSCPQSFPASRSFPMSQLFMSSDQSIGASASVIPMNIQGWFSLVLIGLIFLLPERLSRVFSNTTVQNHQFLVVQPSLWPNSVIHTWLPEKP